MPNMNVAPNGQVDIPWWDFRNDTGAFRNDLYMVSSSDNGRRSPNIRVTNQSIDRKIGRWANGTTFASPMALTATERYTPRRHDTRNGDADGQAQYLYGAFVQFEALPPPVSHALGGHAGRCSWARPVRRHHHRVRARQPPLDEAATRQPVSRKRPDHPPATKATTTYAACLSKLWRRWS